MYIFITIIILVICVLLGLIVLVQNPKGGGLNQSLGGVSNQVFGAKKSTNLVEQITWYLAIAVLVLSLSSAVFMSNGGSLNVEESKSRIEKVKEEGLTNQPGIETYNPTILENSDEINLEE